ncbi:MAG: hypothetical protein CMF42_02955 [Legionellales bacterium]|nr:hypothetical protein [Legionellales bacterium]OUX67731.1 MAG: hypothetical protein CBD38_01820 [bacterium TMED178]|tara:strand:- start:18541 stop:18732 length:192 start_codon:yes stop_codon:yes gene_type:complete
MAEPTSNKSSLDGTREELDSLCKDLFGDSPKNVVNSINDQLKTVENQVGNELDSSNTSGPSGP